MSWVGVITDEGRAIYNQYSQSGVELNVSAVKSGSGTVSQSAMRERTALVSYEDDGVIESKSVIPTGTQFRLRFGPATEAYTMKEIGLFVTVTEGGSEVQKLFAYCMETGDGVDIPAASSFADFIYMLSTTLIIDNTVTLSFTIDPSSYVSYSQLSEAVAALQEEIDNLQPEQEPVPDPTASGTSVTFIDSITQDRHGVITPTKKTVKNMVGATGSTNGAAGFVPPPSIGQQGLFLRGDGTWQKATYDVVTKQGNGLCPQLPNESTTEKFLRQDGIWVKPPNTTYTASTGLTLNEGAFSLAASGVSAGSYGPSTDVTGNDNTTMNVPYITVDQYGRITSVVNKVFTAVNKNTTYTAGTGLSLNGTAFSLVASGASAGSYGPSTDVTGNDGTTLSVPYITVDQYGRITSIANKTYTSKNTDTTYTAGTGLSLSSGAFSLGTSGVTAGTYGPSANVTGNNNATINVPEITVDKYGRITSITNRVYTSVNSTSYLPLSGGTVTGVTSFTNNTQSSSTSSGAVKITGGLGVGRNLYAAKVYNAVWNDMAECRVSDVLEGGRCVAETETGVMKMSSERLQAGCRITSDTFGYCMGETDKAKTPIAIAGRVLAHPYGMKELFSVGDPVCSGPNGTVDVMTRQEVIEFPDRIVGIVSEIPDYEEWIAGTEEEPVRIPVNGRIWIYVR